MYPRLISTPYFTLHTFGVLLALAFVAAIWWVAREARREGLDPDRLTSLGFWAIAGGLAGSKLLLVLRRLPDFIALVVFTSSAILFAARRGAFAKRGARHRQDA